MAKNVKILKIRREYLESIISGEKSFEIRFNDRDYQVGDVLVLREYEVDYTGRTAIVEVVYMLDKFVGLAPGYVAMSIKPIWDGLAE